MSNAFDKASLVMLPHAYEEGKLYSLKPTDRSGDFTFSRGADTATRVGEDGYIKKEHSNLLEQSNKFDTTWSQVGSFNVVGNQQGYDSSNDAWSIESNNTAFDRRIQQLVSVSGVHTFAIYAKSKSTDWVSFYNGTDRVYFDLANGVVGSSQSGLIIDSKIEATSVAGWYRCTATFNRGISSISVIPASGDGNSNVVTGNSIYIQDAQVNQGLVATPYLETTTAPVYGGLTDNMPRLDYTDATCPSLLLEPERTNLITSSEYLLDGWTDTGCTITKTNETNPSGNDISYFATAIDSDNADRIRYFDGTKNGDYYFSFFAKGDGNAHQIYLRGLGGSGAGNMYWDVAADGTIFFNPTDSDANGSPITEDFGNGWYRIGFKQTFTGSNAYSDIRPSSGDINSGIYIWGVQWEQGSYPTSYIPTYGSAQTRVQDDATLSNIDTNIVDITGDFTFYLDNTGSLMKGTELYYYFIELYWNVSTSIRYYSTSNGSWYYKPDNAYTGHNNAVGKQVIKYENGVFYHFLNGSKSNDTRTMATSDSLSRIQFFADTSGKAGYLNIKKTLLFDTALSDDECIALTQN